MRPLGPPDTTTQWPYSCSGPQKEGRKQSLPNLASWSSQRGATRSGPPEPMEATGQPPALCLARPHGVGPALLAGYVV